MCPFYYLLKSLYSFTHNLFFKKLACKWHMYQCLEWIQDQWKAWEKSLLKSFSYRTCSPVCVCAHTQHGSSFTADTDLKSLFPFLWKNTCKKLKWAGKTLCLIYDYSIGELEPCLGALSGEWAAAPVQCGNTEHGELGLRLSSKVNALNWTKFSPISLWGHGAVRVLFFGWGVARGFSWGFLPARLFARFSCCPRKSHNDACTRSMDVGHRYALLLSDFPERSRWSCTFT